MTGNCQRQLPKAADKRQSQNLLSLATLWLRTLSLVPTEKLKIFVTGLGLLQEMQERRLPGGQIDPA